MDFVLTREILFQFQYVEFILMLAGAILGALFVKNPKLLPIVWFIYLDSVCGFIKFYLATHNSVYIFFHFSLIYSQCLVCWFIYTNSSSPRFKKFLIYASLGFFCLYFFSLFRWEGLFAYPSYMFCVQNIVFSVFTFRLVVELLDLPAHIQLSREPVFIFCIGLLFFNLFSFMHFLLTPYTGIGGSLYFQTLAKSLWFSIFGYYTIMLIGVLLATPKLTHIWNLPKHNFSRS